MKSVELVLDKARWMTRANLDHKITDNIGFIVSSNIMSHFMFSHIEVIKNRIEIEE